MTKKMTKEEFLEKKKAIIDEACNKRIKLEKEYAHSHNTIELGDIVSDHSKTIIVEGFTLMRNNHQWDSLPILMYTGTRLTRKGVPFKNGEEASVFQGKVQRVIKKDQK